MNPNTHDSYGIPDDEVDPSDATIAYGTGVEDEIFLQHFLGVRVPRNPNSTEIADRVARHILSVVDASRYGIEQVELSQLLEQRIRTALGRAQLPRDATPSAAVSNAQRMQQVRAIAETVRETIPQAVMQDFLHNRMPAIIPANDHVPINHMRITMCIIGNPSRARTVEINMNHPFWKEKKYGIQDDLRDEIRKNRDPRTIGITITPPLVDWRLEDEDIDTILNHPGMPGIDVNRDYGNIHGEISIGANNIMYTVNLRGLIRARLTAGDLFASLTSTTEIETALQEPDIWNTYVSTDTTTSLQEVIDQGQLTRIAAAINIKMQSWASPVIQRQTVLQYQQSISEQHKFVSRLKQGSENYMGAAMAATLLMEHRDLDNVLSTQDRNKVQADLNTAREQLSFARMLDKLENISMPTTNVDLEHLVRKLRDIERERGTLSPSTNGIITIGQSPIQSSFPVPTKGNTAIADVAQIQAWLNTQERQIQSQVTEYEKIQSAARPIVQALHSAGVTTGLSILDMFDSTGARVDSEFTLNMNLKEIADQVRDNRNMSGKSEEDLKKQVEDLRKQLKDIDDGKVSGPSGDEAQHKIIAEYLRRYRGLDATQANAGANYLRGRSLLDADMGRMAEEAARDLYGENDREQASMTDAIRNWSNLSFSPERRSRRIIANLAQECHIPVATRIAGYRRGNPYGDLEPYNEGVPNWSAGSYRDLMTAYFALKQLYEGKGPGRINFYHSGAVREEMHAITKALLGKYAKAMIRDWGKEHLSDEEVEAMLHDPRKAEFRPIFQEMLATSDLPENYKTRVQKVIEGTNSRTDAHRRRFLAVSGAGAAFGGKTAKKVFWDVPSGLAWKNPKWSLRNGVVKTTKTGTSIVSRIGKKIWNNKGTIATFAGLSLVGGPLIAAGATYVGRKVYDSSSSK